MIFVHALIFGVTLAIAIGPIALLIIRYAATEGFWAGLASAGGAALADFTYAVVALCVGLAIAPLLTTYTVEAQIVASVTLVAFGLWTLWTASRAKSSSGKEGQVSNGSRGRWAPLITTYVLTVVNPLTVIAFLAFIGQIPADSSVATRVVVAIGLFVGSLSIQILLALGGAVLGRVVVNGRGIQILNLVSGIGIVLFGVVGLLGLSK